MLVIVHVLPKKLRESLYCNRFWLETSRHQSVLRNGNTHEHLIIFRGTAGGEGKFVKKIGASRN